MSWSNFQSQSLRDLSGYDPNDWYPYRLVPTVRCDTRVEVFRFAIPFFQVFLTLCP